MAWTVWADNFETGELSNTNKFQSIKFKGNYLLKAIRTWVLIYNDPVFTNLNMKIYSNDVVLGKNTPKNLITTSVDVRTKAEVHTLANGVKEIYFTFNDFPVQSETIYNLVINGSGYVPTLNSYLGWVKSWPDPVYQDGYTPTFETLLVAPYQVYAVGSEY